MWARDDAAGPVTLRQRIEYGDAGDPDQPAADRAAARAHNLLGRPVAHYDEAGLVTVTDVDFKGNVLDTARQVIADAPILATYERAAADGWQVTPFHVDWQPATRPDPGRARRRAARPRRVPHDDRASTRSTVPSCKSSRPTSRAAAASCARATTAPAGWSRCASTTPSTSSASPTTPRANAPSIAYGNGVMTRYSHDPDTFRLTRMRSERYTGGGLAYRPTGEPLQDYGYDYDLVGNILTIRDRTPESGIPNNPDALTATDPAVGRLLIGGNALNRRFTYDPTYRLVTATGRECDVPPSALPSSRTTNREFSSPGATAHCRPVEFPAVRHSACPAVCAALAVRCLISHISHYRNIR